MDEVLKIVQKIDIANLIAMGMMLWVMYGRIEKQLERLESRSDSKFLRIECELIKIQSTMTDIDRRLCRLEGAFQAKDCCLLKSDSSQKVAQ